MILYTFCLLSFFPAICFIIKNSEENDSQRNVTETCQNPWGYLIGVDFDLRGQEQDINEQGYRRKGLSLYKT